eukprot:scaffold21439_cov129-Isochrysis_galbana.AAC.7
MPFLFAHVPPRPFTNQRARCFGALAAPPVCPAPVTVHSATATATATIRTATAVANTLRQACDAVESVNQKIEVVEPV